MILVLYPQFLHVLSFKPDAIAEYPVLFTRTAPHEGQIVLDSR